MTPRLRCLMIGAGGFAGAYAANFLPPFLDRLQITGLVDLAPEPLQRSGDLLGVPANARFATMEEAFARIEADFCLIVVPPAFHKQAVLLAAARGMNILSEKPIADTWEGCQAIYRAVQAAGVRMQVVQNYRYNPAMLTFRKLLRDGVVGRANYLMGRFAEDYRQRNSWGKFRHEIPHSLLVEGAVHHFDMLRNLAGAPCETIAGWEWNPPWSSFDGESSATYVMRMANGVFAHYEGNCSEAGRPNGWHQEYYRAECEAGAVVVDSDGVVRLQEHLGGHRLRVTDVPLEQPPYVGHQAVLDQFLNWIHGGPTPETVLDDNILSAAMLFAATEASATNQTADVAGRVAALVAPGGENDGH
ncbi:MAG: Gfo/Idh/MocA family oxidoreductase [Armatimonadetes bacterium]|nr:Gfo/Idh/MocA family oxidoreductase [Armatimonadota bacterium]